MLTVIDEFTRRCMAVVVERRLNSDNVLHCLTELFVQHGPPDHIRSDNGSEFTAHAVRDWLGRIGVKTLYIEPGSPWENGYNESFNSKLRDEILNTEIFSTLKEAKVLIERWRHHYNTIRPHSSLGYRPPAPETILPNVEGPTYAVDGLRLAHQLKPRQNSNLSAGPLIGAGQGMVADTGHPLSAQAIENKVTELLVAGYPLSEEQIEAIRAVTSSSGRVAIIKGAAGSGKTTTLRPIADLYREHGSDIIATGVAWRTVVALGNDVAARPFCVDKLLRLPDHEDYDTWRNVTDFAVGRCGGLMDDPGRYAIHLDYIVLREVSLGSALSRVREVLEDDDRHLATILAGQREGESIRSREEFVARLINDLEKLRELRQQRAERKAERQQQSKGRHWSMRM